MKEYVEKLYTKLHESMEKPVTLGSAEEVGLYAKTSRMRQRLTEKRPCTGPSICRMPTARPARTGRWNRLPPLRMRAASGVMFPAGRGAWQ